MPKAYEGHKSRLEDFWANLQDSFEVREKRYSWLSVPRIRNFEIETNLPKELRDDGDLLDPTYEQEIDKPLSPIRWSGHEEVDIDRVTQTVIDKTRQWLSLRVRLNASKGRQKESTSGVPQSRGYKEYARKTRFSSRKNTSTDPEEVAQPEESTEELLKQVHERMSKAEILKKAADFGIREGLGAMPLVEVLPVRAAIGQKPGEGIQEEDEQEKTDENTQPPPDTTSTSTQPSPIATTQAPILTSTTTTPLPTSSGVFAATSTTLPQVTTVLFPALENVSIHNIESESDQEDEQPMEQLVQRRTTGKKEKKFTKLKEQVPIDPMNIDE